MTAPTLTGFLLARIAEDEAMALDASIGSASWHLGEYDETVLWWPPSSPEKIEWNREHFGDEAAAEHARWKGQTIESSGDKIAPHIARHDPSRVLAQCEAYRSVVEAMSEIRCFHDVTDHDAGRTTLRDDVLAHLASIWADHEDYREEWKP